MTDIHRIEYSNTYTYANVSMTFTLNDGETLTHRRLNQLYYLLEHWQAGYAVRQPLWVKSWALWGQRAIRSTDQ